MKFNQYFTYIFIFSLFLNFLSSNIQAQDSAFSQYFMSKLNLNPAYVASELGTHVSVQHREQWVGINPFRFSQLSLQTTLGYCTRKDKHQGMDFSYGLGILGNFDKEGVVSLQTFQTALNWGVLVRNFNSGQLFRFASLGVKVRYNNLSLNGNDWVFSGQIDPVRGPTSGLLPNAPLADDLQKTYYDTGIGGIVSFGDKAYFNLGVALDNIRSKDNLLSSEQEGFRPERLTIHTYIELPTHNRKGFLLFDGKFENQATLQTLSFGPLFIYKPNDTRLFLGVQYRDRFWKDFGMHTNAVTGILGTRIKTWNYTHQIALSYDFQTSGLVGANSWGAFEISYVFSSKAGIFGCKGGNGKIPCPSNQSL